MVHIYMAIYQYIYYTYICIWGIDCSICYDKKYAIIVYFDYKWMIVKLKYCFLTKFNPKL